jgi:cytosine/adenosine deaminase-related metal-dependent hydrolase
MLKGATVLSMDTAVGDFARGDILIEGKKIAAVGPDLGAASANGNAIVIEAADRVIIPGMVDCHRHAWEGQLRGIIPNSATIGDYMGATHRGFAPFYQPEDMYVGNLATALGCLDAGITCVIDNSHNARSPAHSDAAIQAWFDSGMRAVHASGAATFGEWDHRWPQDSERLMKQFFASDDQLVTFRLFSRGLTKEDWEAARRLGVWLSVDGAGGPKSALTLQEFQKAGLLDEKHTINHGYGLADESWKLIRDAGMPVNACPRSDSQWALGDAHMGLQGALNAGIRPGLSVDNDTAYSTDMFSEMRAAFQLQRWTAHMAKAQNEPNPPALLSVRDMLEFATIRGAANAALTAKIGSLTPGKEADIVVIGAEDINTMPLTNAVATVVQYAHAGNVEAVFVAGNVRKWRGSLVGQDIAAVRQRIHRSRDELFARRGMKLDVLA